MKKQYEKPEVIEVETITCSMLATSFHIDKESQGDFDEDFARKRRGTWGSFWKNTDLEE